MHIFQKVLLKDAEVFTTPAKTARALLEAVRDEEGRFEHCFEHYQIVKRNGCWVAYAVDQRGHICYVGSAD